MYAHDFEMNGIYYNIIPDNKSVQVSCYGDRYSRVPDEYKYKGSVVIPEMVNYRGVNYNVTSIGFGAFSGCDGLTSITIPNSVTTIGRSAFGGCDGLTSITIPSSVTLIEYKAFSHCAGLTSITIPESVISIGNGAFEGCDGLTSITIPNSVNSIGDGTFLGCNGLASITIPNSVTWIGGYAFDGCNGLTSITIPESVTTIGRSAFEGCNGLASITIPNGVTSIGDGAFYGCTGLTSITIPESVTSIGNGAFSCCDGLTEIVVDESNRVYDSREHCNAIIETASNSLIAGCKNTVIPNSVTSIGDDAFYGCTGLTSITIPESVTSIGNGAFSCCDGLTEIVVDESNRVYDSREHCNAIIETASNSLIAGCKNTVIPNSVTSIGHSAFYGCTGLTSITIPVSVTSIGLWAFAICSGLTEIIVVAVMPPIISGNTFHGVDKSIPLYVLAECVEAYRAAEYWSKFTNIVDSYEELSELLELELFPVVIILDKDINAENFTVDGIHYVIGENNTVAVTFYGDYSLAVPDEYEYTGSVIIPEVVTYQGVTYNVASIGNSAFYGCTDLKSITIPNSITEIGFSAFTFCSNLTEITVEATTPPTIIEDIFSYIDKSIPLYVPAGCVEAYRAAEYWSVFTNIIEMNTTDK